MPKARSKYAANAWRYRANLRRAFARATDADKREGVAWYPTAQAGCDTWANGFSLDSRTIACVIAAISPQCDWTSNLRIAFEVLAGQALVTGGALRVNVEKARAILEDKAVTLDRYFKNGPKVTAFAANLSGDARAVTVDQHAVQAAMNNPTWSHGVKPNVYAIVADCYRTVADELGLRPCDFQAIIWCAWKRRYPAARKRAIKRKANANEV